MSENHDETIGMLIEASATAKEDIKWVKAKLEKHQNLLYGAIASPFVAGVAFKPDSVTDIIAFISNLFV